MLNVLTVVGVAYLVWRHTHHENRISEMNDKLNAAVAKVLADTAEINGKLDSALLFIDEGVPALVEAAVADALETAGVEADEAADLITAALDTVKAKADAFRAAIDENDGDPNTPPVEPVTDGPATGEDEETPAV